MPAIVSPSRNEDSDRNAAVAELTSALERAMTFAAVLTGDAVFSPRVRRPVAQAQGESSVQETGPRVVETTPRVTGMKCPIAEQNVPESKRVPKRSTSPTNEGPCHNNANATTSAAVQTDVDGRGVSGSSGKMVPTRPCTPEQPRIRSEDGVVAPLCPPSSPAARLAVTRSPGRKNGWYVVTAGLQVGVFQGWHNVSHLVTSVPDNSHHRASSYAAAVADFDQALANGTVKVLKPVVIE